MPQAGRFVYAHPAKRDRSFEPSFYVGPGFINRRHEAIPELVAEVKGKLRLEDHLKLYEAGYFARGPILEIGRDAGRSTVVLALGAENAGHPHRITSIDIRDERLLEAVRNLRAFGVLSRVSLVQAPSAEVVPTLGVFETVFVDGDHSYEGVRADCLALRGHVTTGGAVLFHDYLDERNDNPDEPKYAVSEAVDELAAELGWEFRGSFGAIGAFEQTAS